ncbi:DUF6394 family protein [Iodobacter sp. LRB]|uniref:Uncharacterized protein n=1 Tax=Iodobacter violaceini TaxID=3044271 RepID=A0ABX0KZ25_9NEIS|nr:MULTISPECIES: DUF6394 family protein [Iodobacter]NHQ87269.1 hypothetical protein [Iodobacter violacea]PHV01787.1 hypothetical protein CSQ88_10140 [Iodobacter sp. BJB302]
MNIEKVVFGFFILLAFTLNFGFVMGQIDVAHQHDVFELFSAMVVSFIATVIKFGDRTQVGALHLATSLVADLQLIAAALVWGHAMYVSQIGMTPGVTSMVVSFSAGALAANVVSVVLLIGETLQHRR